MRPCEPIVKECGPIWRAWSPPDYPLRIGVEGATEGEARRWFVAAFAAWEQLEERRKDRENRERLRGV